VILHFEAQETRATMATVGIELEFELTLILLQVSLGGHVYFCIRKYERQTLHTVIRIVWCTCINQECIQTNGMMKDRVLDAGAMNWRLD
jgi:hypothetical protein